MNQLEKARQAMVERQLKRRGIVNQQILQAMGQVPRHSFVSAEYQCLAYKDTALPIGHGQTISQPYIVARSIEALNLQSPSTAHVLEIGTGLGYQAAVLSRLVAQVYTVEHVEALMIQAKQNLAALNYQNVRVSHGDGGYGWPKYAPYDGIIVSAAAPEVPPPLLAQLKPSASLIIPVGTKNDQKLICVTNLGSEFKQEVILPVAFVPLIGEHGWSKNYDIAG